MKVNLSEDVANAIEAAADKIAHAIVPQNCAAYEIEGGGRVLSATEAMIFMAENLGRIASAIGDLADAVREQREGVVGDG